MNLLSSALTLNSNLNNSIWDRGIRKCHIWLRKVFIWQKGKCKFIPTQNILWAVVDKSAVSLMKLMFVLYQLNPCTLMVMSTAQGPALQAQTSHELLAHLNIDHGANAVKKTAVADACARCNPCKMVSMAVLHLSRI